jgi:hypothetical protein
MNAASRETPKLNFSALRVAGDDGDEFGRAELRGLEKQGGERNENDDGKPGQGQAERDPKARDHVRPTPRHTTGRGKRSLTPHFARETDGIEAH